MKDMEKTTIKYSENITSSKIYNYYNDDAKITEDVANK